MFDYRHLVKLGVVFQVQGVFFQHLGRASPARRARVVRGEHAQLVRGQQVLGVRARGGQARRARREHARVEALVVIDVVGAAVRGGVRGEVRGEVLRRVLQQQALVGERHVAQRASSPLIGDAHRTLQFPVNFTSVSVHLIPLLEGLAAHGAVVRGLHGPPAQVTFPMLVQVRHLCVRFIAARLGTHEGTLAGVKSHVVIQIC